MPTHRVYRPTGYADPHRLPTGRHRACPVQSPHLRQRAALAGIPHMQQVVISGTGLFTPAQSISNAELVAAFNAYATGWNAEHATAIAAGELAPMQESSEAFIEKASGIRSR